MFTCSAIVAATLHGVLCRQAAAEVLTAKLAAASSTSRGASVREVLSQGCPRLATLLEEAFKRIEADTQVSVCSDPDM